MLPLAVRNLLLLLALPALISASTDAEVTAPSEAPSCRVRYEPPSQDALPLLFGGVYAYCKNNCQPRENDAWSDACSPINYSRENACQPQQTLAVVNAVKQVLGGVMMQFSPCELHTLLKNRTLWVVGDSHMRFFYQALRCFLLDFWDHQAGECAVSLSEDDVRLLYQAADTTHTSVLGFRPITDMPKCFHLLEGGRICWIHSVKGEEFGSQDPKNPGVLQVLQSKLAESNDIFWLNFGRWHFHNCVGAQKGSYSMALHQIGRLYKKTRSKFPYVFFKVPSHDHTACIGDWNNTAEVKQCLPADQGNYPLDLVSSLASTAKDILGRYGLPVVDTYPRTVELYQAHINTPFGKVDCPGIPEWEIWRLHRALTVQGVQPAGTEHSSSANATTATAAAQLRQCTPVTVQKAPKEWRVQQTSDGNSASRNRRKDGGSSSSSSRSMGTTAAAAAV